MSKIADQIKSEMVRRGLRAVETPFGHAVFTADTVASTLGLSAKQIAKAMLVKVSGGSHAVVVIPGDRRLDVHALQPLLKGKPATLAERREIPQAIGLPVGAVTPLVALVDNRIAVIMEGSLLEEGVINISSGDLTMGLNVSPRELADLLRATVGSVCS